MRSFTANVSPTKGQRSRSNGAQSGGFGRAGDDGNTVELDKGKQSKFGVQVLHTEDELIESFGVPLRVSREHSNVPSVEEESEER